MVQDFNEQDPNGQGPKPLPDVGAGVSNQPDSLADQTEEVRRYAAEHGLEIVAEYVDEHRSDVSGFASGSRPWWTRFGTVPGRCSSPSVTG